MTPTTNQGGDPSVADMGAQGADQSANQSQASGQFIVCISDMGDGTYQVYSQDSDGDQDDSQGQDNAQTADNVDDALQLAKMMLEQESDESGEQGDANAMLSPDDAKAAWNQMAAKRDKKRMAGM